MPLEVKICGINDKAALKAAVDNGAALAGFVFYPPSPRALTPETAAELAIRVPQPVVPVGLFVDPRDDDLRAVLQHVPLGMIQLHGTEPPKRVAAVRAITGLPVMKAIGVSTAEDLQQVPEFEAVADRLLFDAKPLPEHKLPGGNALAFDWSLLAGKSFKKPWMLAGGLNAQNLAEAVKASGARAVDVSSGVEDRPGLKNPEKIRALLALAGQL